MLLRHSLLYALGRGVPGLVSFFALAIYTRLLSVESYGHYAMAIAGVNLANVVVFQWLRLGLLRFLPAQGDHPERLLGTIVGSFLAMLALLAGMGGLAVALAPDPNWRRFVVLGVVLVGIQAWFEIDLTLARSQLAPVRYGLMALARAVLALVLGSGLILVGLDAEGPLLGLSFAMLASSLVFMSHRWRGIRPSLKESALLGQLLRYGLPLTATYALNFVVISSDRFLITWLLDVEVAGRYAAGYDIAGIGVGILMTSVNLAGYSLVVHSLEQRGEEDTRRQLSHYLLLLMVVAAPAATGLAMCAPNIAEVMLGAAFREVATTLIPWIAFASVLAGLRFHYLDLSFHLGRRTFLQAWIMLIAAVTNIVLNFWWIPRFGFLGAAYATVVAYALAFVLSWRLGYHAFPLPPPSREAAVKIAAAAFAMALLLWPTRTLRGPLALAGQILLGGGGYVIVLLALDVAGCRRWLRRALTIRRKHRGLPAERGFGERQ